MCILNREQIKQMALNNGFTLKEGDDLRQYVYDFAEAILTSPEVMSLYNDSQRIMSLQLIMDMGGSLVSDDNGKTAVSDSGMQPMPPDEGFTETVYISSIVEPELWKDSVRSAIDYYTGEVIYG